MFIPLCTLLDIVLPISSEPSPVLVGFHAATRKVIVASSQRVGGRSVHKGCILLKSILQTPARKKDDSVCVEIPLEQVIAAVFQYYVVHVLLYVYVLQLASPLSYVPTYGRHQ